MQLWLSTENNQMKIIENVIEKDHAYIRTRREDAEQHSYWKNEEWKECKEDHPDFEDDKGSGSDFLKAPYAKKEYHITLFRTLSQSTLS